MPNTTLDGIKVEYVVTGTGTPLLMLAPGGFDSTIDSWERRGVWQSLRPLAKRATRVAASSSSPGACSPSRPCCCSIISASNAPG